MLLSKFPRIGAPLDKIPITTYKKFQHIMSPLISELFNLIIRTGIFPTCLKVGRVISTFISEKYQLKDYTPITTSPVLAKVCEKLMHKSKMDFINKFNIRDHNTSDTLLECLDNAYEAVKKKTMCF